MVVSHAVATELLSTLEPQLLLGGTFVRSMVAKSRPITARAWGFRQKGLEIL